MQKKNNLLRDSSNSSCKLALANVSASLNRDSSAREQDRSREFWHLSGQQGSLISETDDNPLRKLQNKILQLYSQSRDNDLQQEWKHYLAKSQLLTHSNKHFLEIEKFLLKHLLKLILRRSNNVRLVKPLNSTNNIPHQCQFEASEGRSNKESDIFWKEQETIPKETEGFQKEAERLKKQAERLRKEEERLKKDEERLRSWRVVDQNGSILLRPSLTEEGNRTSPKTYEQILNALNYQNTVLQKRVETYESKIQQCEWLIGDMRTVQQQNGQFRDIKQMLISNLAEKTKLKQQNEIKAFQFQALNKELGYSRDYVSQLRIKNQELEDKAAVWEAELHRCREYLKYEQLWRMADEEVCTWRLRFHEEREERERIEHKLKMVKQKNKQLLNYFNGANIFTPDQEEDKQDLQRIINDFRTWLKIVSVPKVAYLEPERQEASASLPVDDEINYKLVRPNFYIYFESFQKTILMEKNVLHTQPIEHLFFPRIRAIFDAMYLQFSFGSYKQWTSFPELVVGFLEKYELDRATCRVKPRKQPVESEEKLKFIVDVFNVNLCCTWECELFRSFLLEDYSLDQVYFFLDCRNDLNGGKAYSDSFGAADPISYVKLTRALQTISRKLASYESFILERIRNIMRAKKKLKHGEAFIDKHFVLKLLLEVYAFERIKSEKIFDSTFHLKMKKSFITYHDYQGFMRQNFPSLSSTDIALLYRQTYTLSSGHVTSKAIHYVCSYKGLFIPLLLAKRLGDSLRSHSLHDNMPLLQLQNTYSKQMLLFQNSGLEESTQYEHSFNMFLRQLDGYKQNKQAFYARLCEQMLRIVKASCYIELQASLLKGDVLRDQQIEPQFHLLRYIFSHSEKSLSALALQQDKKSKALTLLVRNFKIRVQESIIEFQKVNDIQVERLKKQTNTGVLKKLSKFPALEEIQTSKYQKQIKVEQENIEQQRRTEQQFERTQDMQNKQVEEDKG